MSYVTESDIRVKCYDHSNLLRASAVQFRASRWFMSPNRTSVWNVITIRICRELPLFNFERLDELCHRIGHPCEKLNHSNFSRASAVQFRACRWVMSPNRTFEWKLMTIRISRELPLLNFERLDELCPRIEHPCEKLWPFEFLVSFRFSISSDLIYCVPESDIRVKSYDHSNSRELPLFNFERLD